MLCDNLMGTYLDTMLPLHFLEFDVLLPIFTYGKNALARTAMLILAVNNTKYIEYISYIFIYCILSMSNTDIVIINVTPSEINFHIINVAALIILSHFYQFLLCWHMPFCAA